MFIHENNCIEKNTNKQNDESVQPRGKGLSVLANENVGFAKAVL